MPTHPSRPKAQSPRPHKVHTTLCLIAALWACNPTPAPDKTPEKPKGPVMAPVVPDEGGDFAPSLTRLTGSKVDMEVLTEVEKCVECHEEIVGEWRESMHAFSSLNNPLYAVSLDDFIEDRDPVKARFCNGCHDVALQFDATPAAPRPDDKRAHAGITCNTCHGIVAATTDGNGSYTLSTDPVPYPKKGDPDSLARHKARLGPAALRTDALCASCHRGFIGPQTGHPFVALGMDEVLPWRRSPFGGSRLDRIDAPVPRQGCASCHMEEVVTKSKTYRSHRFPGGHATFARMIGAETQFEAHRTLMESAAGLDIFPMMRPQPSGGALHQPAEEAGEPGDPLLFDVVLHNRGTGHNFPGGARDLRDTWLSISIEDAQGKALAAAGNTHEATGQDPSAHRLRSLVLDDEGEAVMEHAVGRFRVGVYDRTVPPGDVSVVRYAWQVPEGLDRARLPLKVRATLRHRRVQPELQKEACRRSKQGRGAALLAETARLTGIRPDPCIDQPVLDIALAELWVGKGALKRQEVPDTPRWFRLLLHGRGLRHHLQERLSEALAVLLKAEEALSASASPWSKASVLVEQAATLGRMGRTDDAVALLDRAEALQADHPAIAFTRGEVYALVWRWEKAEAAFAAAARLAPEDDRAWQQLAIARGSLGQREASLLAAQTGLRLNGRDPHLLRSQSLALQALMPDSKEAALAKEVWLRYRRDDGAPGVKAKCKDPAPACQQERVPIYEHALRTVGQP